MNSPPAEPDRLARALADWHVEPRRNPGFRTKVWARIESARRVPNWVGYLRAHRALVAGALAAAMVLGALGGREHARGRDAAARAALVADYVRGLDARSMQAP